MGGAGEVLEDEGIVPGFGDVWGEFSPTQDTGDRSVVGRGDMGTFQMTASSGSSSSSSSHSASRSLTVFLFESCHDCLLAFTPGDGRVSKLWELLRDSVRVAGDDDLRVFEGEGDREDRCGAARLRLLSEGTDGEAESFPGADSCECCLWTAWLT